MARARNDRRFEELIECLDVGVVSIDRRSHVISLNAAAVQMFGVDPKRSIGRAFIELVPSIVIDRALADAIRGTGTKTTIELSSGAVPRRLAVAVAPVEGGVLLVASDQTRVTALESIRRDFVSNVSHELRTPLASIRLMVETVLASADDADAQRIFLPKIMEEVNRMIALVRDLLDIARAESGQIQLRKEQLDLTVLANEVLMRFAQRAQVLGIVLHPADPTDRLIVDADRDRLTQVFVNLIDNALRHTPRGGSIRLSGGRAGSMAKLAVIDSGDGIPYKDLPHIFERFYVVDRSRAREVGGTGLGLSIVKELAEAHGGTVAVESELGRGATFILELPLAIGVVELADNLKLT